MTADDGRDPAVGRVVKALMDEPMGGWSTVIEIHYDWLDRIRILFGRKACVHYHVTTSQCDVDVIATDTVAYVYPVISSRGGEAGMEYPGRFTGA